MNECLHENSCDSRTDRGNCTNTLGSYFCSCFKGFELIASNKCNDTDECVDPGKYAYIKRIKPSKIKVTLVFFSIFTQTSLQLFEIVFDKLLFCFESRRETSIINHTDFCSLNSYFRPGKRLSFLRGAIIFIAGATNAGCLHSICMLLAQCFHH